MKKEALIQFIEKYTLGDAIKAVNWKVDATQKTLRTRGELESKTFIADVTLNDFTDITENIRIPIGSGQKIKAMLSPFGEDIAINLVKNGDRPLGFTVSDKDCESYCCAADISTIAPVTKEITGKLPFELEIQLTSDFVSKFLKARSALNDCTDFTVKMNKNNKAEIVLGYSVANQNRITLLAPTINGKDTFDGQPIRFPIGHFVEILKANKEIDTGVMYFHNRGIINLVYKNPQFTCSYLQFAQIKK